MTASVRTAVSRIKAIDVRELYDCEHPDGHVSVCVNLGEVSLWFESIDDLSAWWDVVGVEIAKYRWSKTSDDTSIESTPTVPPSIGMHLKV